MSEEPVGATAGVNVLRCWWGRETKPNIVVKCRDFKITIRLTWGGQTEGGRGGQSVAGAEVGVAFCLTLQRLRRCLRRAEGAVWDLPVPGEPGGHRDSGRAGIGTGCDKLGEAVGRGCGSQVLLRAPRSV